MRVKILLCLAVLISSFAGSPAMAQTVATLELQPARNIDGLYVDSTGILHASGTFRGSNIFQIDDAGTFLIGG